MRIIMDTEDHFIAPLVTSLSKDPASLERWNMVHMEIPQGQRVAQATLGDIKTNHPHANTDVVVCADGDIIMLSQTEPLEKLRFLAGLLTAELNEAAEIHSFALVHDWRDASQILLSKARAPSEPAVEAHASFGEIELLSHVFHEAKALRKTRHPMHVMIVEDDPVTRRIVSAAFKDSCAIISASTAEEAVANYLLYAPDIVFLDIGLPDVSGFDVLHQLMESDPDAYIVMFSGSGYIDNVTKALNHGAAGFISKPFKKEKMHYYIQSSARHHQKSA